MKPRPANLTGFGNLSGLRLAFLLVVAFGCLAGSAAAQAPDTAYSLTWWTVDAGGASYASTGGYSLGGTAGQPDAAAERSDGGYSLTSGFWQPSCVAAAVVATIARDATTITLSWTHNEMNQAYQVHRATTPYFAPAPGTMQEIVTAAPWSDDEVVIGNPAINYFYLVRATCGAAYADAGRVGEFDFALTPGAP
jgi:hypothetical protein